MTTSDARHTEPSPLRSLADVTMPAISRRSANVGVGDTVVVARVPTTSVVTPDRVAVSFVDESVVELGLEASLLTQYAQQSLGKRTTQRLPCMYVLCGFGAFVCFCV